MVIIFFPIFYLLTLLQISFFPHFDIKGLALNFPLIFLAILLFLQSPSKKSGWIVSFFCGFLLDIYSFRPQPFFGFYILISLVLCFLIKYILQKYVRFPIIKKL